MLPWQPKSSHSIASQEKNSYRCSSDRLEWHTSLSYPDVLVLTSCLTLYQPHPLACKIMEHYYNMYPYYISYTDLPPPPIGSVPPPILPGEQPPPYTPATTPQGGVPMINCRVCQSMINLEGRLHQHVVKCGVCHEATVSTTCVWLRRSLWEGNGAL